MLLRFDPFRDLDRLFEAASGTPASGVPRQVPMDAYRSGDTLHVTFDLPGIDRDTIDLTVERNQLTLTAERRRTRDEGQEWLVAERPVGRFTRQLMLGDNLDTDNITADFADGVLRLTIPVSQAAKARKVSIGGTSSPAEPIEATSSERSPDGELEEHAVSA
jgi:HSP20 family protein